MRLRKPDELATKAASHGVVPSFDGLSAASRASSYAKKMTRSSDTAHEHLLRVTLWRRGLRYRKNVRTLPGKPDIVFPKERVAVFCDGDFWHGRHWRRLSSKLRGGANPSYWTQKIKANRSRDRRDVRLLRKKGGTSFGFGRRTSAKTPSGPPASSRASFRGAARATMRFIDLFAGLGGFHVGLASLGHECVFASELDTNLQALYEKNFGVRPHGDIRSISADLASPRMTFSARARPVSRSRKPASSRASIARNGATYLEHVLRVLKHHKPEYIILENVPNLERHNKGETWSQLQRDLRDGRLRNQYEAFVASPIRHSPDSGTCVYCRKPLGAERILHGRNKQEGLISPSATSWTKTRKTREPSLRRSRSAFRSGRLSSRHFRRKRNCPRFRSGQWSSGRRIHMRRKRPMRSEPENSPSIKAVTASRSSGILPQHAWMDCPLMPAPRKRRFLTGR